MIAYFLASVLWLGTSFLANLLITFFGFAFGLDLVDGSRATGGAGALGARLACDPLDLFRRPRRALARARDHRRRHLGDVEGAGAASLLGDGRGARAVADLCRRGLFFVAQPGATIGSVSQWTIRCRGRSSRFPPRKPPVDRAGEGRRGRRALRTPGFKPWVVLEFGGLEHCVVSGTGSGEDEDPVGRGPAALLEPARDGALARRCRSGRRSPRTARSASTTRTVTRPTSCATATASKQDERTASTTR